MDARIIDGLDQVSPDAWNALIGANFPFLEHDFLRTLEETRCVGANTGWLPQHLLLHDKGQLVGAVPLYLKTDSYGEYIFDWEWANAYQRHGLPYYPKLTCAIPYTPATGPRLLVHPKAPEVQVQARLLEEVRTLLDSSFSSSLHFLFIPESEVPAFKDAGFIIRHSYQFHWSNPGYADFAEFLEALKGRRRKEILRERRQVREQGLEISWISGDTLQGWHADLFYRFYRTTIHHKWSNAYLTRGFFHKVFERMASQVLLVLAMQDGECVAGTLNFHKGKRLYGRYWGCTQEFRSLHFELCYYQTIEYAIQNGIELFEAGAQGPHKLQRGFLPSLTYSAHWIGDPAFRNAISEFNTREQQAIATGFAEAEEGHPYRKAAASPSTPPQPVHSIKS